MNKSGIEAIAGRIAHLEREVRLWKRGAAAMLAMLGVLVVLGSANGTGKARASGSDAKELTVSKLTVVDEQGKPRITLADPNGVPEMRFMDEHGRDRAYLMVSSDGASFRLLDTNQNIRTSLGFSDFGEHTSYLMLWNERDSEARATLIVDSNSSTLSLPDRQGTPRAVLSARKDGLSLKLSDEHGNARAIFGQAALTTPTTGATENTGPSSIALFGPNGKMIWRAP
jgi:hypothetical protein